jgi:hypothetical protein
LVPKSDIKANPSDVAAWPCEATDNARLNWRVEDPDNRNRAGGRLEIERQVAGDDDNQAWILTNYLASEFRIMRGTPFAGIAFDQEIAPFDIA